MRYKNSLHIRSKSNRENNDDFFYFDAEISNTNLDSYHTRMEKETTLNNFVEDAIRGVMLQDSHDYKKLGYGNTIEAYLDNERVIATFEVPRGINFGGQLTFDSTDDFIMAVERMLVRDVSVGFYGGREVCDIDGFDVWGWNTKCEHFPGQRYDIEGKNVTATATIKDSRLSEVSAVFDGATPEAQIIRKIESLHEQNQLTQKSIEAIPELYGYRFNNNKTIFIPEKGKGRSKMEKEQVQALIDESIKEVRESLTKSEETNKTLRSELDEAKTKIADLEKKAEQTNRSQAEKKAHEEYIRAFGDEAEVDENKSFLSKLETEEEVETYRKQWEQLANAKFSSGHKTKSTNNDEDENEEKEWKPVA